jgi:hypothetical protein
MSGRIFFPSVVGLLCFFSGAPLFAEGYFSGGGGDEIQGASYRIEEGILDFASRETLSSTHYNLEGEIGSGVPAPPEIQSVEPGPLSRFFEDEIPAYAITVENPGPGNLQYQLRSDETVKAAWQASAMISYPVSSADAGRHALQFMVKNQDGSALLPDAQYIFRRPHK